MRSRRLKRVGIDLDLVARLFLQREDGPRVWMSDLFPAEAQYEASYVDLAANSLFFVFSHPDWEEVPQNEYPPMHYPLYHVKAPD